MYPYVCVTRLSPVSRPPSRVLSAKSFWGIWFSLAMVYCCITALSPASGTIHTHRHSPAAGNKTALPGDIHPDVKYIDADRMYPFNDGAAIVEKGVGFYAMIDRKGNFLIPYNKVNFIESAILLLPPPQNGNTGKKKPLGNGLFPGSDLKTGKNICYTANGKQLTVPGSEFKYLSDDGLYAIFASEKYPKVYTYVDKHLSRYVLSEELGGLSEGIGYTQVSDGKDQYGRNKTHQIFKTLANRIVSTKRYDALGQFHEGMAIVGITDEFRTTRYGFIDSLGREVIPPTFTRRPSDFNAGLARVVPQNTSDFLYAYINKKGEVVIRHTRDYLRNLKVTSFSEFQNGYAYDDAKAIMSPNGKITLQKDFFAKLLQSGPETQIIISFQDRKGIYDDGFLRFSRRNSLPIKDDYNVSGYVNIHTGKTSGTAFLSVDGQSYALVFDPVSKLAYAQKFVELDKAGHRVYRKGYINEDGLFVILQKPESLW